jgi:hypothetical protein
VRLASPDPARFASEIIASLCEPTEFADISGFEWATLARTLRRTLADMVEVEARRPSTTEIHAKVPRTVVQEGN